MVVRRRAYYHSPIGIIEILGNERGITVVHFVRGRTVSESRPDPELRRAVAQIAEYFQGKRKEFSLSLHLEGTEFQKKAWRRLIRIPYGETSTYAEVARAIGRPDAARAVGQANHRNPISIVVPCHRVVGSDGRLVGYGGGLWRKQWFLAHERKFAGEAGPAD